MTIPLLDLREQYRSIEEEILPELKELCASQHFILGEKVERFEHELAAYCGVPFACGVTSGSDALIISLMVEGIGAGDEVITSPFTFFATVGAIARVGATPIFADVDPRTFNIDPAGIEAKITPRTKAIIPVHLFGQCADMEPILEIARKHRLTVIEDGAQAIGAECRGRRAGSFGDFGCFSFFPSKNLGGFGDGGAVTTSDPERAKKLKIFRNHGQSETYIHRFVGGNFRLDALQAAVLSVKLRRLDQWTAARQANAAEYARLFREAGVPGITLPGEGAWCTRHVYNQYTIRVADGRRDALKQYLNEHGIGSSIYYPVPLHLQECFAALGGKRGDFPAAEQLAGEVLSIPIYPESTTAMRQEVVGAIAAFMK